MYRYIKSTYEIDYREAIRLYDKGATVEYFNPNTSEWKEIPRAGLYSSGAPSIELFHRGIDWTLDKPSLAYRTDY